MKTKPVIACDFDGVIHKYSKGWQDGSIYDEPMEGAQEYLKQLSKRYTIIIFTSRSPEQHNNVRHWLNFYNFPEMEVTNVKPIAKMYIDDRAVRFTNWLDIAKLLP